MFQLKGQLLAITMASTMFLSVSNVSAGEHAHFAAFFNNMTQKGFSFPDVVRGDQIEQDMGKLGGELMIFAHSAGIKNGDVWTLQNDTLREMNGELQDFGMDCKLSLKVTPFKVAGVCSVFMSGGGAERTKQLIKPIVIQDEVVWYKVFEDKHNGLAGYFMRETAADFNH